MRIVISGREYQVNSIARASLTDLLNLKRHTGLTLPQIQEGLERLQGYENPGEVFGDDSALLAMGAVIWLARWKAGDGLGFEEACDFPLDELEFVKDPGDDDPAGAESAPSS